MVDRLDAVKVIFQLAGKRIWITGYRGMIASALARRLAKENCEILTDRANPDLREPRDLKRWLAANKPDAVFVTAARVGGIMANATRPADFLYDNLAIATNVIHASAEAGVAKLMFLGAACMYPRMAPQPIAESALLEGPLDPINQWFGVAKIAGTKLCEAYRAQLNYDFVTAVPTTVYGPGDRFDSEAGNVIPALLVRAHEAKLTRARDLTVWGSGKPLREFIYVDDCADALVFLMKTYSDSRPINVGTGQEVSIDELARKVAGTVKFSGQVKFDSSKPDGMPRKLLDSSRIFDMGWRPTTALDDGLVRAYQGWLIELAGSR
jgi:GDP-L-fucose synthase